MDDDTARAAPAARHRAASRPAPDRVDHEIEGIRAGVLRAGVEGLDPRSPATFRPPSGVRLGHAHPRRAEVARDKGGAEPDRPAPPAPAHAPPTRARRGRSEADAQGMPRGPRRVRSAPASRRLRPPGHRKEVAFGGIVTYSAKAPGRGGIRD